MEKYRINGVPPSKKNSKIIKVFKGRPLLLSSENYQKWHKIACSELLGQVKGNPISACEKMYMTFNIKDKRRRDLDNLSGSVYDALVDVGILEDDNYFVVPELNLKYNKSDEDYVEIIII